MLQYGLLAFTLVATMLAVAACLHARGSVARCSRLTSALSRTMKDAETSAASLAEIRDSVQLLNDRYENLRTRVGMRETRAAREEKRSATLQGAEWKLEMRKQLGLANVPKAD